MNKKLLRIVLIVFAILPILCARAETPAQVYEVSSVGPSPCGGSTTGLRCSDLTNFSFVMVNGYYAAGDGGGGYFVQGACNGNTDNGGTILQDGASSPNCFYRASTNWNAREWGARCDVAVPNATLSYTGSGSNLSSSVPISASIGTTIVVPGLGSGPFFAMGQVGNGSDLQKTMGVYSGSGYQPNDTVVFSDGSGTASEHVTIMVDTVDSGHSDAISTWHFLKYGSFTALPTTTMTATTGTGSGAIFLPVWSGSTYVGTLSSNVVSSMTIPVTPTPGLTSARTVNSGWYYGHDDSTALNKAILTLSALGATQINLPGKCGTIAQISSSTALMNNPPLVGLGQSSSGLYALAPISAFLLATTGDTHSNLTVDNIPSTAGVQIGDTVSGPDFADLTTVAAVDPSGTKVTLSIKATQSDSGTPVTFIRDSGHLYNRPSANRNYLGGGLSNMTVEAMGLTQDAVIEIDGGKSQTYSNLEVRDAIGASNAVFRCGSIKDTNADAGGNFYQNIRAETDQALFSGAQFPDFDLHGAPQCHDSQFYAVTGVNAKIANIMHVDGGGLHIDHPHTFNPLYPDVPGAAMYGIVSALHDYIVGAQIDDANFAGLFLAPNGNQASSGQRAVETWVDCANFKSSSVPAPVTLNTTGSVTNHSPNLSLTNTTGVQAGMAVSGIAIPVGATIATTTPLTMSVSATDTRSGNITVTSGYRGVEISDGDYQATITATSDEPKCGMMDVAIVQQDGTASPSTAVFANSHASYSTIPSVYSGVLNQAPQGRLTLSSGHPVMTGDATNVSTVYYAPYTGMFVPIFNGVNVGMYQFTSSPTDSIGLSLPLSSSAHTGGHLYDLFVFTVGGIVTLGSGPQWSNATTRSAALQFYQGLSTNSSAMTVSYGSPLTTYSCPSNQCTYVGTVYITTNGETCMQFMPTPANGGESTCGSGAFAGLWNAYNRVTAHIRIIDNNTAWNAKSMNAWEPGDYNFGASHTNVNNRINFVDGLQVVPVHVTLNENNQSNGTSSTKPLIGLQFDSTASTPGPDIACKQQANQIIDVSCEAFDLPLLGLHYAQAMEQAAAMTSTPFGSGLVTALDWEY